MAATTITDRHEVAHRPSAQPSPRGAAPERSFAGEGLGCVHVEASGKCRVVPEPVVLVTCATWPNLSISDQCLAKALQSRGANVDVAPWNGPFDPFSHAVAVVLRAAWDYHSAPDDYRKWLARLNPAGTFNPPALVHWNLEKTYLLDLAARGATVPRSAVVRADPTAVLRGLQTLGVTEAVLKPTIGASGYGVERVRPGEEATALCRLRAVKSTEHLLIQEFVPEISAGELAGVFSTGSSLTDSVASPRPMSSASTPSMEDAWSWRP
jgi:hypothetical protein